MSALKSPFAKDRRMRWDCPLCGAGLLLLFFLCGVAPASDPGRGPPTDTGPPILQKIFPPDSTADPPRRVAESGEFDPWHQNLIRERQVEVRLRSARRNLEIGNLVAGLTELQSIIEREDDVFVRFDTEPVPCGAHTLAARWLSALPAEALAAYQTLYGTQARQALDAAVAGLNPDRLARVVRNFYHTEAGFEAGNRLAAYLIDHGSDELAWGWWERVLPDPSHRRRVKVSHRLQAASCARRLGRTDTAREIVQTLGADQTVTVAGRPVEVARYRQDLLSSASRTSPLTDAEYFGSAARQSGASPPAVSHLIWRQSLAGDQSRHIESLARAWEGYQLQNGLPLGTAQFPLLAGDTLIFRDYEGLRAVKIESGAERWFFPCSSALSREISPRQTAAADGNPDPNNVMRLVVGNCTLGLLTSDGRHVYAIDRCPSDDAPPSATPGPAGDPAQANQPQCNLLLALPLDSVGGPIRPRWAVGGREPATTDERGKDKSAPVTPTLAGHFFLGAPLPVANRLFVISEWNHQIYLSCLAAETGNLIWKQLISSVSQPIATDYQRFGLACSPVYGDGIVLCPTNAGVLIAVDALCGALVWAVSHDDGEPQQRQQMSAWPYTQRRKFGHPGYPSLPVVHRSNVIFLPAHSEYLHCIDRATGVVRWRTRREDLEASTATEYVAAVTDETVVLIGHRKCRGLAVDSGVETWAVSLGSSPAGHGARLGSQYHIPLDDGRIASLDLETGRNTGSPRTFAARPLGNLAAGENCIVSLAAGEISVFPQAHVVLERLEKDLADSPQNAAALVEIAELELALGRGAAAEQHLEEAIQIGSGTLPARRAADHLREWLTRKLLSEREHTAAVLNRLAALSQAPEHLGPYLLERCRSGTGRNDVAGALAAARELAAWQPGTVLGAGDDPSRTAAPWVLAAAALGHLNRADSQSLLAAFEADLAREAKAAFGRRDIAVLRRLEDLSTRGECAAAWRLQRAQLLSDEGALQRAELALLACRESQVPSIAGRATRRLAELWIGQGLEHDAARLFSELALQYGETEVAPGQTGTAWLAAVPRDSQAFEAYRRLAPPAWAGTGVKISEAGEAIPHEVRQTLETIYNGSGVQHLHTPRTSPFDLFDKGRGANGSFSVVNRYTGVDYPESIVVPGRTFYPASPQPGHLHHAHVGHFFPLGALGAFHGISLLERKLLWSVTPRELEGVKEVVRVGPAGPGFCTFQHRQHLFVVDPADGRLLWHRNDLESAAGLVHDPFLGIIGDDRVLVVFATNGANYTVYETSSGAELRRGRLDAKLLPRRAFGRRLFHHTIAADTRRLRVWDALTDQILWDEPADRIAEASVYEGVPPGTKVFAFVRETDEAVYVTNAGHLRVVDLPQGREKLDLALPPDLLENLSYVRAFRDRDRYYVNLQCSTAPGKPVSPASYPVNDSLLPCAHIEGELCAVDAGAQKLLWRRCVGKRSLLHLADLPLPALVSLSRVRSQDQSQLAVEVIDAESGETLATRYDLPSDRLLQASYDRQGGLLELRGAKSAIRLLFPTSVARLSADERAR